METKKLLQKFECYVDSVDADNKTFWAVLKDATNPDFDDEMGEFDFSVFPIADHENIKEGYLFNWEIGEVLDDNNSVIRTFSDMAFLKMTRKEQAAWRKHLVKAKKEGRRLSEVIKNLFD